MATNNGQFCWYDLMTTDMKAAQAFYAAVIGWEAKDSGMAGPPYTLLSAGPTMVGGLMPIPDELRAKGVPPSWSGYVWVEDVDAYAGRVKAAGGTIRQPPADIPGIGRYAVVADPGGAVFILFKNAGGEQPAPVAPGTRGHIGWHELHAWDGARAWAFYSGLFGWTKAEAVDMGPMGVYQTFATKAGAPAVGGMMTKMPQVPATFWLYYFNVESIDAALARVTERGGKAIMGPQQVPGGQWILQAQDPQGAFFAMVAAKR
jgi:uncharacterized protein